LEVTGEDNLTPQPYQGMGENNSPLKNRRRVEGEVKTGLNEHKDNF
jgi:hypothetical protein